MRRARSRGRSPSSPSWLCSASFHMCSWSVTYAGSNTMSPDQGSRSLQAGLIGSGIQHSSSPSMHVDEAKALGLQISYELLDFDLMKGGAELLPQVLEQAEKRGFSGLNITYPSKQAVIPLLDE